MAVSILLLCPEYPFATMPGLAWPGLAWFGLAWSGLVWSGRARPGLARSGMAWLPVIVLVWFGPLVVLV